jgi:hypothetical protein
MIDSTVARIEAAPGDLIDSVGNALRLASVIDRPPGKAVEVYVVPISERRPQRPRTTGKVRQEAIVTIGIVIGIRTLNDPDGERSADKLEPVRVAVRDQLLGFKPNGATTHYLAGNSDLIKMLSNGIWWLDRYLTKTQDKQP